MARFIDEWRDIPGYNGMYQVNYFGEIRSWRYRGNRKMKQPKLMTPFVKKPRGNCRRSSRVYVKLADGKGKSREVPVINIMVDAWFGSRPAGKVAYHKDGVPSNNSVHNIGFTTLKELGAMTGGEAARIPVVKVTPDGEIVEVYPSARAAAKANHMSYQTVLDRCNGKVKKPFALDGHTYKFER